MSKPTKAQEAADKFDATLFRLLWTATSNTTNKSLTKAERDAWDNIRCRLGEARSFVTPMRHPEHVKAAPL